MSKLLDLISGVLGGYTVSWGVMDRHRLVQIYQTNPYVYSIIQKIVSCHENIRYMVVKEQGGVIVEDKGKLWELLKTPNKTESMREFLNNCCRSYFVFGETFIHGKRLEAGNNRGQIDGDGIQVAPAEIMTMKTRGGEVLEYILANVKGISPENVLHIKNYNPDWKDAHGLPFLKAAKILIEKMEAADELEVKNFQNGGPAWVASAKSPNSFEEEQYFKFIDRFKALWKSPKNKGGIIGTSGAIDLQHVGKSPVDLGSIQSTKEAVKFLCTVYGLEAGTFDTEASTYNNKLMIEKAIYTGVVIPYAAMFAGKLTRWLGEAYGGVRIEVDTTSIDALQANKRELIDWMVTANVFTPNEIREAVSYTRVDDEEMDRTPQQIELTGYGNLDAEVIE